jgi:hypothetical protein
MWHLKRLVLLPNAKLFRHNRQKCVAGCSSCLYLLLHYTAQSHTTTNIVRLFSWSPWRWSACMSSRHIRVYGYERTSAIIQCQHRTPLFICHRLLSRHKCESRQTRTEGHFAKWHELYRSNPLIHLINICYLSISVTSWERWTWTNTGHFSVSYELSVNVTQAERNTGV